MENNACYCYEENGEQFICGNCDSQIETKIEYQNIEAGFYAIAKQIEKAGIRIIESHEFNMQRYRIIKTENKTYLVSYKRELFFSFGEIFKHKGETGYGETINVEDLKMAICNKKITDIIFVHKDGEIYIISLNDFMEFSHRRVTDSESKAVRSVSIKHLKRFEDTLKGTKVFQETLL